MAALAGARMAAGLAVADMPNAFDTVPLSPVPTSTPLRASLAAAPLAADYSAVRRAFYAQHPHFEADVDGREYALYQTYDLSYAECALIREAASGLWHLYARIAPLLRELSDDALLGLGLPLDTLAIARAVMDGVTDTVIGRFDLARTPQGYKMLEFNADTPTFLLECFQMNGRVCHALHRPDPNACEELRLADALTTACRCALKQVGKHDNEPARIAFASFGASREDRSTTEYLLGLTQFSSNIHADYVPIEDLRVSAQGLYDAHDQRIDALFRLYPLEFFALDRDPQSGAAIGRMLFDLVLNHKLALINPPSAFLLQSKAVQAVLWGLAEANAYLDQWEIEIVRRYMLPTYLDPVFEQAAHVIKPVLGREGDSVAIVTDQGREQAGAQSFANQPVVYQQYADMPCADVLTCDGLQNKRLLTSCFVVDGQPSAIGIRAGGRITDARSLFLPVSLSE